MSGAGSTSGGPAGWPASIDSAATGSGAGGQATSARQGGLMRPPRARLVRRNQRSSLRDNESIDPVRRIAGADARGSLATVGSAFQTDTPSANASLGQTQKTKTDGCVDGCAPLIDRDGCQSDTPRPRGCETCASAPGRRLTVCAGKFDRRLRTGSGRWEGAGVGRLRVVGVAGAPGPHRGRAGDDGRRRRALRDRGVSTSGPRKGGKAGWPCWPAGDGGGRVPVMRSGTGMSVEP